MEITCSPKNNVSAFLGGVNMNIPLSLFVQ